MNVLNLLGILGTWMVGNQSTRELNTNTVTPANQTQKPVGLRLQPNQKKKKKKKTKHMYIQ